MGCQETLVHNVCLAGWWFCKKQKQQQKLKSVVGSGVFVCIKEIFVCILCIKEMCFYAMHTMHQRNVQKNIGKSGTE